MKKLVVIFVGVLLTIGLIQPALGQDVHQRYCVTGLPSIHVPAGTALYLDSQLQVSAGSLIAGFDGEVRACQGNAALVIFHDRSVASVDAGVWVDLADFDETSSYTDQLGGVQETVRHCAIDNPIRVPPSVEIYLDSQLQLEAGISVIGYDTTVQSCEGNAVRVGIDGSEASVWVDFDKTSDYVAPSPGEDVPFCDFGEVIYKINGEVAGQIKNGPGGYWTPLFDTDGLMSKQLLPTEGEWMIVVRNGLYSNAWLTREPIYLTDDNTHVWGLTPSCSTYQAQQVLEMIRRRTN